MGITLSIVTKKNYYFFFITKIYNIYHTIFNIHTFDNIRKLRGGSSACLRGRVVDLHNGSLALATGEGEERGVGEGLVAGGRRVVAAVTLGKKN